MYQNIFISRKDDVCHLWDDERGYSSFPYVKYAYKRQTGGQYKSIYGDELTKVYNFDEKDPNLFESDISPEMRILMDLYGESDEPSKNHRMGVIDIEVSTVDGFPNMETTDKEITSIALYDDISKICHVFILDKDNLIQYQEKDGGVWAPAKGYTSTNDDVVKIHIKGYNNEENLLMSFLDKWQECQFTIVTGWHCDLFDFPYLYGRLKNVLGAKYAKVLSPIGTAYVNAFTKKLTIAGISILDYLSVYKKIVVKMEPSYTLDAIGKRYVGMGKIPYKGNLNDLFKQDLEKFIEYNITDVKIVVALDKKFKFIDLVKNICHTGHVPYESYSMSSRFLDGTILMYLKRNGNRIAPNKPSKGREEYEEQMEEDEDGFEGAFVKEPVPGRYNWVFDLDLTSMYPNIIISLNISPETKVGTIDRVDYVPDARPDKRKNVLDDIDNMDKKTQDKFWSDEEGKERYIQRRCVEFDMEYHVRNKLETYRIGQTPYSKEEFYDLIKDSNYSLSSNGVLYSTDKKGVIPEILQKWFNDRKDMRKKASECRKKGDMTGYNFYNQRQQVQKILLNSVYGCLGLPIFRWYDIDNALAVTASGISIIKTTAKAINQYYKQELGVSDGDWVIYIDTDSCFVNAIPIIKKRFPDIDFKDDEAMTKAIMIVTTEVQSYVNTFYNVMAQRFFNINTHTFDAKQEVIAKTALWLAKKRYAQWIIHKEGVLLEEPEMDVKGIDVVRTSFPAAFRKYMEGFLKGILKHEAKETLDESLLKFKDEVKNLNVVDIAKNTSVKFVSKDGLINYNPESRKPFQHIASSNAQVKAALNYNDMLVRLGLNRQYEQIHHGQKIKWVYLNQNPYNFDNIALKGDGNDPDEIIEFVNQYVDRTAMFEKELKSKLVNTKKEGIYDVLKWQFPNSSMIIASQFFA